MFSMCFLSPADAAGYPASAPLGPVKDEGSCRGPLVASRTRTTLQGSGVFWAQDIAGWLIYVDFMEHEPTLLMDE